MRHVGYERINKDESVVVSRQRFVGADFGDRRLKQFSSEGCRFEGCRFDNSVIESAAFGAGRLVSEYVGCTFDGAKLAMGGGYARFVDCSFDGTLLKDWFCFAVEMVDCTFTGRLQKVVFNGAVRSPEKEVVGRRTNQFEGNDFSRAKLIDVDFRTGIDLSKQRLPAGDDYVLLMDGPEALRRARAAFEAWDDPALKLEAGITLGILEGDVAAGQQQLLMRPDDFPREARPAIWALLEAARGD